MDGEGGTLGGHDSDSGCGEDGDGSVVGGSEGGGPGLVVVTGRVVAAALTMAMRVVAAAVGAPTAGGGHCWCWSPTYQSS